MSRNHLLIALLACCSANLARGQEEFVFLEIWSPRPVYGRDSRPEVIVQMTNDSKRTLQLYGNYRWYSLPCDFFVVHKDGAKLRNKVKVLYDPARKTTLEKGESITVAFYLDDLTYIPEPANRLGLYRVKLAEGVRAAVGRRSIPFVAHADLWFAVLDKGFESPVLLRRPVIEEDLPRLHWLLESETVWPADRLRILELLAETKNERTFWMAAGYLLTSAESVGDDIEPEHYQERFSCKDVYALVKVLPKLPRELLDPGHLYVLCRTTDLALRRAALKAMARCGPDEKRATKLKEFLDTQRDDIVQELGKKALSALKGQGR